MLADLLIINGSNRAFGLRVSCVWPGRLILKLNISSCVRLVERGRVQQRMEEAGCQDRQAYVYTPSTSEAGFVRMAVE
jgi:hypothetical protein